MLFHLYALFLVLSGIAMVVLAGIKTGPSSTRRILSGILGVGFTGYGLYLLLFFKSGHYVIFYYAFILPIVMIVRFFRDRSAFRARQQAATLPPQPPGYAQPPQAGYAQPPRDQPQEPIQ